MSTVYVLGAGFSKAMYDRAPLNDELLSAALEEYPTDHTRRISAFINTIYHPGGPIPPIEDVLSLIDDALLQNRPLSREYNIEKLREVRMSLIFSISDLLKHRLEDPDSDSRWSPATHQFTNSLDPQDVVITTNYDLIVDHAITRYRTAQDIGYGFEVRQYLELASDPHFRYSVPLNDSHFQLLKLHGSLNWLYCPSCQAIDVSVRMKGVTLLTHEDQAPRCQEGHAYEPLLIVPSLLRSYDNPIIEDIWRQAEEALAKADKIVIGGYSLPQADILFRTRLIRALNVSRNNRALENLPAVQIIVVDRPYAGTFDEQRRQSSARDHYERILGPEIRYEAVGFEKYVLEMIGNPAG